MPSVADESETIDQRIETVTRCSSGKSARDNRTVQSLGALKRMPMRRNSLRRNP